MADVETDAIESRIIFVRGDDSSSVRDLIDAAHFRGEVEPIWRDLLRLVAAEKKANESDLEIDDAAIDTAAEQFRYEHDLITAEETERWLDERGLTLGDFSAWFVRRYWGETGDEAAPEVVDYLFAPVALRALLTIELILGGELDRMAARSSWRVAARQAEGGDRVDPSLLAEEEARFLERSGLQKGPIGDWLSRLGRDDAWLREQIAMEAVYLRDSSALLSREARSREISALRLPLTLFEVETIEFDSLDAAREALLCVRQDGMAMEEVAGEGRYPYRHAEILLEDVPEDLQQKFLSVTPGAVLEPITRGEGFHLCRILGKAEPNVDDPTVKTRAEDRILDRHFGELTAKHIQWKNLLP
ncbi:MAG: hypothetical protein H0X34_09830 [Chthoniobacterales bacterium]|nr:hypothetical protein [Chthoniobacterales bacterium]